MDQLISYQHSNRIKVGMWIGAVAMVVFVYVVQPASAAQSNSYIVRIVPICILAFFWIFFLQRAGIGKLADEVHDFGDRLQIRRGKINEVVPLSRFALAEASTVLGTMNVVKLTFIENTSLGKHIAFLPSYERGRTWSTEASRLAIELTGRSNKARSGPAN
jgi:hypothetical protein